MTDKDGAVILQFHSKTFQNQFWPHNVTCRKTIYKLFVYDEIEEIVIESRRNDNKYFGWSKMRHFLDLKTAFVFVT